MHLPQMHVFSNAQKQGLNIFTLNYENFNRINRYVQSVYSKILDWRASIKSGPIFVMMMIFTEMKT